MRQGAGAAQAAQELVPLLHDDQVGGEVGVEDLVDAQLAQGGHHAPLYVGPGRQVELVAQSHAHRGSELHDREDIRIVAVVDDALGVVLLGQGAHRTDQGALPAGDALAAGQLLGIADADLPREARARGRQGLDALHVAAHLDTAAAADALGHVPHDGGRGTVHRPLTDSGSDPCSASVAGRRTGPRPGARSVRGARSWRSPDRGRPAAVPPAGAGPRARPACGSARSSPTPWGVSQEVARWCSSEPSRRMSTRHTRQVPGAWSMSCSSQRVGMKCPWRRATARMVSSGLEAHRPAVDRSVHVDPPLTSRSRRSRPGSSACSARLPGRPPPW